MTRSEIIYCIIVIILSFSTYGCESYLMEHEVETTYVEELVYEPTFVAVKFLYHGDDFQYAGIDTIYLEDGKTFKWDIRDYRGVDGENPQFDIVHFTLVPKK